MSNQTDQQLADRLTALVKSYQPTVSGTATSYTVTQGGQTIQLPKLGNVVTRSTGTRR